MLRRTVPLLACVAATGLFAAGCGSDNNKKSDSTTAAATTPASTAASTSGTTGSTSGTTSGGTVNESAKTQAIAACKQSIEAQPTLGSATKADLEKFCTEVGDAAGRGDAQAAAAAAKKLCLKLADAAPAGAARDAIKTGCAQAGTSATN
jgi:hypothetical protein